jgi:hypothetical protein
MVITVFFEKGFTIEAQVKKIRNPNIESRNKRSQITQTRRKFKSQIRIGIVWKLEI